MKRLFYTIVVFLPYSFLNTSFAQDTSAAESGKVRVFTFELRQDIMPAAWRLVKKAMEQADSVQADYVIITLNTYGGMLNIADSIRTRLLKAKPVTAILIDNNAASAGALIAIACDSIYMVEGASIGAATVVNQTGEQLPDKYQSYMRSMMRATAEAQGRDPKIAEAMVDDRIAIPGLIDSGFTLTFTTSEAIQHGFCEGQASSVEEVIRKLGIQDYELIRYKGSAIEPIIAFFLHPVVSSVLLLIILGGLYFELQTPGVGFPLIAAVIAAILYFAPLYLEGLAENWEILLFIAGLGLLAVEIFLIPGFGITGIAGILLIVTGLTLSLLHNVSFDFSLTGLDDLAAALFRVIITLMVGVILFLLFGEKLLFKGVLSRVALMDSEKREEGYISPATVKDQLIGKTGIAITDLRPSGIVEIDAERYDVISDGEMIPRNSPIKVIRVQSNYLVVERI
ncbi:MAG: hypothetical protein KatS3mg031_0549 [Chitinophagales bacterium]|nr:MAG: hypothetical protein KatS3mg031_0549 [Chitinophagales bacterium]